MRTPFAHHPSSRPVRIPRLRAKEGWREWHAHGNWGMRGGRKEGVRVCPPFCAHVERGVRGKQEGGTKEGGAHQRGGAHSGRTHGRRHAQGRGVATRGWRTPFAHPCSHGPFARKGVGGVDGTRGNEGKGAGRANGGAGRGYCLSLFPRVPHSIHEAALFTRYFHLFLL